MSASNHMIPNSQQCPHCRQWITLPYQRTRAAFDAHKRRCAADRFDAGTDEPAEQPCACGRGEGAPG